MQVPNGLKQEEVDAQDLQNAGNTILSIRQAWYRAIGDGIFLKEQRGEGPSGTWQQAVEDMKAANPWPANYVSPTAAMLNGVASLHSQMASKAKVSP